MADLTLKIKADFAQAVSTFKELSSTTEDFGKKLKELNKEYDAKNVDDFVKKQKLAQGAITATRGPAEALANVTKNYQRKIEELIKNGLDPEGEHVKKLRDEYEKLKGQLDAQSHATGSLKDKIMGMVPGLGAAVVGFKALSGAVDAAKQFIGDSVAVYERGEVANARRASAVLPAGGSGPGPF